MSYKARAQERASNLQDQEMHQYYQPWLTAHGSATNVASNVDSIAAADLQESGYRPRSSQDRALTAFAQLATLRLNVRRAMVSLIDSKYQYILTEATRTVSLISENTHEDDDELWLGNTILNREDAVCHHCFDNTYTAKDRDGLPVEIRGFVVPDCREHEDLKDFSYVKAEPGVRFYAGVPIVTRSGHTIGAYAVSDESPRKEGLSLQDMRFMQDIATAVLEHLEWARDRVDRFKGERIVRGLASFIECCSSSTSNALTAVDRNSIEYSYEDDTTASNDSQQDDSTVRPHRSSGRPLPYMPSRRHMTGDNESDGESVMSARSNHSSKGFQRERQQDVSEDYVEKLLRRAARILRKATLADGAVFFGTLAEHDESHGLLSPVDERNEFDPNLPADERGSAPLCQLLGASIGRSIDKKTVSKPSLSVKALHHYFKAYPEGKTLNFSTKGMGLSSEEDSSSEGHMKNHSNSSRRKSQPDINGARSSQDAGRRRKGRISHAELLENLPGIRTLIFIPLRDAVTGRYFAGGFLWTSTANRMMDLTADFSYLKAFGNSISSEIARANAEKLERAKATFIASMSHELRSPLHGILGSVEFLQDTNTDSYQAGLITSIADCSRTLLDTLSNLLSYAKVSTMESVIAAKDNIDLAQVVEEVVEAVCAGHTFKKLHTTTLAQDAEGSSMAKVLYDAARHSVGKLHSGDIQDAANESSEEGTVCVLLDFQPSVSWNVSTNPGALRRIVMNLVGNALKYTTNGFVAVSIRAHQVGDKLEATLRVVDSGKGISEDFQRNHLFVPFKQEDTFASGTGLGLSIVKQLVDSLGGSIRLHSTKGQGTEIEVKFTFESSSEADAIDLPEKSMVATAARTKDLRVCVLDPNDEKERPESNHIARLDKTLSETCSAWFGMEITEADNMTQANTDMFLYTEPPSLEYLLEHHGDNGKEKLTPLIIVCMNATEAIAVSQNQIKRLGELGSVVEVVLQPCGPMKLAKILNHVLDRVEEAKKNNSNIGLGTGDRRPGDKVQQLGKDQVQVSQDESLQVNPYGKVAQDEGKKNALLDKVKTLDVPLSTATAPPGQKADHETRNSAPPMSPRTLSTQRVEQAPDDSSGTAKSPRLHVLLVDDNKINVNLLVQFARKFNLTCEEAYNGLEAVSKFKQAHSVGRLFDVILMDISMPVMDGIEATRAIREYEEDNHVERTQIIALSAFTSADTQQEARSNGVDVYLAKPVKFGQLKKLLLDK
ncbi:hypothetical protein MBLNU457_6996t1 [Dothideomycetes sp. NU457]